MTHHRASSTHKGTIGANVIALRLIVAVSCIAAIVATIYGTWETRPPAGITAEVTTSSAPLVIPSANPPPSAEQSLTPPLDPPSSADQPVDQLADQSANAPHIGVVAGHWGNDTGATCHDGLTEVEINLDVAQRVVYILQALGYQTDLLAEFDPRLENYRATALISIHADSCQAFPNASPPASGFKVASVEDSLVPEEEARLVACLAQCYAARTGMYFHANSITYDMTHYHNFYEIDGQTPGVIIETGFMLNDRHILTQRADLVAQGIVDGIVCFVGDERP